MTNVQVSQIDGVEILVRVTGESSSMKLSDSTIDSISGEGNNVFDIISVENGADGTIDSSNISNNQGVQVSFPDSAV